MSAVHRVNPFVIDNCGFSESVTVHERSGYLLDYMSSVLENGKMKHYITPKMRSLYTEAKRLHAAYKYHHGGGRRGSGSRIPRLHTAFEQQTIIAEQAWEISMFLQAVFDSKEGRGDYEGRMFKIHAEKWLGYKMSIDSKVRHTDRDTLVASIHVRGRTGLFCLEPAFTTTFRPHTFNEYSEPRTTLASVACRLGGRRYS